MFNSLAELKVSAISLDWSLGPLPIIKFYNPVLTSDSNNRDIGELLKIIFLSSLYKNINLSHSKSSFSKSDPMILLCAEPPNIDPLKIPLFKVNENFENIVQRLYNVPNFSFQLLSQAWLNDSQLRPKASLHFFLVSNSNSLQKSLSLLLGYASLFESENSHFRFLSLIAHASISIHESGTMKVSWYLFNHPKSVNEWNALKNLFLLSVMSVHIVDPLKDEFLIRINEIFQKPNLADITKNVMQSATILTRINHSKDLVLVNNSSNWIIYPYNSCEFQSLFSLRLCSLSPSVLDSVNLRDEVNLFISDPVYTKNITKAYLANKIYLSILNYSGPSLAQSIMAFLVHDILFLIVMLKIVFRNICIIRALKDLFRLDLQSMKRKDKSYPFSCQLSKSQL